MEEIIFALFTKISLTSSLAIKSKWRLRKRTSVSCMPWNFSGMGLTAFEISSTLVALIVFSFVWVKNILPLTNTKSPTAICFLKKV